MSTHCMYFIPEAKLKLRNDVFLIYRKTGIEEKKDLD